MSSLRRQKSGLLLLVGVALLLVPVTVYVAQARPSRLLGSLAQDGGTGGFVLSPNSGALEKDKETRLEIRLLAKEESVQRGELVLLFDPQYFEVKGFPLPGPVFARYFGQNFDRGNGVISLGGEGNFAGEGVFMSLKLVPKKIGFTEIKLQEASLNSTPLPSSEFAFTIY